MPENNPYSPPTSDVKEPPPEPGGLSPPRRLSGERGWGWITEGYDYFKESPGVWVLMTLIFLLIIIGFSAVPFGSVLTNLFMPVFLGGMMLACHASDEGKAIRLSHLFAGFQVHTGKLVGVGGLYLLGGMGVGLAMFVIMALSGGLGAFTASAGNGYELNPAALGIGGMLAMLVALLLMTLLIMAFWFASPLVALHGLSAPRAMQLSFRGCMKNLLPFSVYGLAVMALGIIAAIPLFLGYLVLSPVLIASAYAAYKDIFLQGREPGP
ncbi:MAG TPA: hypothetical protein ENI99_12110 [Sedimenticola sp.]|nr:hypothetical protein [Sedimenticola sp.]